MNGQFDLITLIALVIAAVAILKLRSVLGHRTDEDEQRVERLRTREREAQKGQSKAGIPSGATGEVISLPRRDREEVVPVVQNEATAGEREAVIRAYAAVDASVTDGLLAIAKVDQAFDPEAFVSGSGRAYELIVSSFADGNRKALKDLLSRDVYEGFVSAITEREKLGEAVDQQFVGIRKAEIVDAELKNGIAYVTVRFISELITARRDKSGAVIDGDPQKIKEVTDIWTFSRDVSTARARGNLNWRLEETQAPN